nr:hypothetical protein [Methylomicrobium lacus]
MMEVVGVTMALDELRKALDVLQAHLDELAFEEASQVGYQDVAHHFMYLQRTLAGLQAVTQQKTALISSLAQEANVAYENVAPYVEEKMQSALKKTETIALSAEDLNASSSKRFSTRQSHPKRFVVLPRYIVSCSAIHHRPTRVAIKSLNFQSCTRPLPLTVQVLCGRSFARRVFLRARENTPATGKTRTAPEGAAGMRSFRGMAEHHHGSAFGA